MMDKHENGIGRVKVSTIPLQEDVKLVSGTYTYSGKVLLTYKREEDAGQRDFYRIAVLDDDGSNFRDIFVGEIPQKPKANGIRFMPYQDNRRVLLGDYVLECSPDIDHCAEAKLIPVIYPPHLVDDPRITHHWSEIIIAPDNRHMSWTALRSDVGAAVMIGTLERQADHYTIEHIRIISSVRPCEPDPHRAGYVIPRLMRGGEVKQFVRGGKAISAVGAKTGSTTNSVIQYLDSEEMEQITFTPGYDETTILSPDERLGIVMTSRFSKKTDPAIFGLMPRPYGMLTSMGITWALYTYSITGVRHFRPGNIGPALIDVERSMKEPGYLGIQLTTDENWVYCSPMSWHPDGTRAMWPEVYRGSNFARMRLQKVELLDYRPREPVPVVETTDEIPYAITDFSVFDRIDPDVEGRIAGKVSGYIEYVHKGAEGRTEATYVNYSDDGEQVYNGYERVRSSFTSETYYEAKLKLTGPNPGEMDLKATFSPITSQPPARLIFEPDEHGRPKSYGYATYNGVTLRIEDLLP